MSKLEAALTAFTKTLVDTLDDELKEDIQELVSSNDLDDDANVPNWLLNMFEAMTQGVETDWIAYSTAGYSLANITNFIAELEDYIPVTMIDEEEIWKIVADASHIEVSIGLENKAYKVAKIS